MAKVYKKKSSIQGMGLYAKIGLKEGELIGRFKGRRTNKDGKYVLWVYNGHDYHPFKIFNLMKYANHSPSPNAEVIGLEMYSIKDIPQGEEITFHYGEDFELATASKTFSN
jgi:hypothetical protein